MIYSDSTRESFDENARYVLDRLRLLGKVEVLSPEETMDKTAWFVQCWPAGRTEVHPVGAFGNTAFSAAARLLQSSKCWPKN